MKRTTMILALTLVTACGGGGESASGAVDGEELFRASVLADQAGCITCHSLTPDRVLVGPSMAGIGTRAGSRVGGVSAREYLRESIVDPDAYVVDGFQPGRMPSNWDEALSGREIDAIVEYLETLS
jgi:nitric oxide reductase subunit C